MTSPRLTVLASINLDFVATADHLPAPGETVVGARLGRYPGGKGANQALAAQRLGAEVAIIGRVGADVFADEALALLRQDGVDLSQVSVDPVEPTALALIAVSASGENQIVVASGANLAVGLDALPARINDPLLCQLEMPLPTIVEAVARAEGFVGVNLAPARDIPDSILSRADLVIVNELEAAQFGDRLDLARGLVARTWGRRGAGLFRAGRQVAVATPPSVTPVDTTGAGDAFVGALTVALLEGRPESEALAFACAAGALATTRPGAQTALPWRAEVEAAMTDA